MGGFLSPLEAVRGEKELDWVLLDAKDTVLGIWINIRHLL
jgi:hypothetical protein